MREMMKLWAVRRLLLVLGGAMASGIAGAADDVRQAVARRVFAEYPQMCKEERRQSVLDGKIELGMTPYEAKLAGGEFSYKVIVDPAVWQTTADPIKVMWTQSLKPDESRIWMNFRNKTQYATEADVRFIVYFVRGAAVEITEAK